MHYAVCSSSIENTNSDPTAHSRARYNRDIVIVKAQRGHAACTAHKKKRGCACSCGHPFSQVPTRPSPVKKRCDPHLRTSFHKPTFFATPMPTSSQLTMSSFHTAAHTTYWSYGPDQMVEDAENEQAAAMFDWGTNLPVTVSLDLR
jgi:hypothetical protein